MRSSCFRGWTGRGGRGRPGRGPCSGRVGPPRPGAVRGRSSGSVLLLLGVVQARREYEIGVPHVRRVHEVLDLFDEVARCSLASPGLQEKVVTFLDEAPAVPPSRCAHALPPVLDLANRVVVSPASTARAEVMGEGLRLGFLARLHPLSKGSATSSHFTVSDPL